MLPEELELWELLEPFPMLPEMLPETPPGEEGVGVLPFMEQPPVQPLIPRASISAAAMERAASRFVFIKNHLFFLGFGPVRRLGEDTSLRGGPQILSRGGFGRFAAASWLVCAAAGELCFQFLPKKQGIFYMENRLPPQPGKAAFSGQ